MNVAFATIMNVDMNESLCSLPEINFFPALQCILNHICIILCWEYCANYVNNMRYQMYLKENLNEQANAASDVIWATRGCGAPQQKDFHGN